MPESEKLRLTYDGQLARRGEMLLYEYGRSQYAFSRIITTVEQYRRRRAILQKIAPASRVRLKVKAPSRGSFRLDVEVDTSPKGASGTAPFDVLLALVLDRLIPEAEEFRDLAKTLAAIRRREIRTGSLTVRDASLPNNPRINEIAEGEAYSTDDLLALVGWAQRSTNRAIARADISQDQLDRAKQILESDKARKALIAKSPTDLDASEIDKLAARVRGMFNELAVPIGDSADTISIGSTSNKAKFYRIDRARLAFIESRNLDEEEVEVEAEIKSFDRESGTGSLRIRGIKGVKYFSLDPAERDDVQPRVVQGMNRTTVTLQCAVYTDSNGIITSYLVRDIDDDN